ncbi:MAG: GNAT family N-acetyltransferase [Gemmatimonadales bacterium]|nr:GNAT family N-acetyltransferase [Gemmatimonadales bacterium]
MATTFNVLRTREAITRLAPTWYALVEGTEGASFSSPWWYLAWLDAFPVDALAVVTAHEGGELVGVLPLGRTRTDWKGMYLPRVAPFARGDFQPPIMAAHLTETLLPQLLDIGRAALGKRHGLWWPNLREDLGEVDAVRRYCEERGMPWIEEREPAPRLEIRGRSMQEVECAWAASHRGDVRRQRRRLEATAALTIWEPQSTDEALPALEDFFEVHDAKWLAQGFPGRFADAANREHFRAALRHMLGKGAHFSTLRVGDTDVSYIFGFMAGGWLQVYRPTFRPEFANFSPSKVHLGLLLEQGCTAGWMGIDFLLGAEGYKLQWSNAVIETTTITAGSASWAPSYLWYGRMRPALKNRYAGHLLRAKGLLQRWVGR